MDSHEDVVAGAAPETETSRTLPINTSTSEHPTETFQTPMTPAHETFTDAVQEQQEGTSHVSNVPAPRQSTSSLPSYAPSGPSIIEQRPNPIVRQHTEALGPATDAPISPPSAATTTHAGPTLSISLLLTTGARHPYKIDEKYLRSRRVEATNAEGSFDPREISGYQLKELVWIDWRNEWEPRPASPSSIRLIIMGRMIEDKAALKDFPFNMENTNVVHMTVKPADLLDDDDNAGKGTGKGSVLRTRDAEERGAGCRCVIL